MTRLANGGVIDRQRPLRFMFNGKRYQGYEGDTLASALVANDVLIVGRSFKYHRPRGILTCGPEEPNALVQLVSDGDQPNLCLLYTSPSPRDISGSRMPSSA